MKLYVDADITPKLARALRQRGYDVLSAHEAGNAEAPDSEQMEFAVAQERALLTCNAADFTRFSKTTGTPTASTSASSYRSNWSSVR